MSEAPSQLTNQSSAWAGAHSPALTQPLFIGDVDALRNKLANASGLLSEQVALFNDYFLPQAELRGGMIALPALLTGESLDEAREQVLGFHGNMARSDIDFAVQLHTWCYCGTALRNAVFFDWLSYRDAWSADELEEIAQTVLRFALKHPYAVSLGRSRSSNNQIWSMTLYCTVVGYLFGHKHAQHPTGKFLFEYGLRRLPDILGLFPADGYAGEGSTYTSHVNTPLACWTACFLEQLTAHGWLDVPFAPNGTTLRKILDMETHLLSRGGLLPPWDHYGWQPAINGAPFACLSRLTGDRRYLSLIPSLTDTRNPGQLAWGSDDPMWTVVWWPEKFADYADCAVPKSLFGWCLPRTGAALDDCDRKVRLMQVWDFSAEGIAAIGRAQTNPNHLMLDYGGEPVFQDGIPVGKTDPWGYSAADVLSTLDDVERDRFVTYVLGAGSGADSLAALIAGISPGLIGAANAIVLDGEGWYWPGGQRVGRLESYVAVDGVQLVSADVAAFYRPRYDVTRACRTSMWHEAGFGIVLDDLTAESAHDWRWQAYLRPNVVVTGSNARIQLPHDTHVLLAWDGVPSVQTTAVEGFPRSQEERSCRLDLLEAGETASYTVLIAPGAHTAAVRRLPGDAIEATIDGVDYRVDVGALRAAGRVSPTAADIYELSDIEEDAPWQYDELEALAKWSVDGVLAGSVEFAGYSSVAGLDACLEQCTAASPDTPSLLSALEHGSWPVRMAAAEALGRINCVDAAPALRAALEAEHAIPVDVLYPVNPDGPQDPVKSEPSAKRWRVKTALIVALGRLRDCQSVPIMAKILADGHDFYPVYSVAAQALGRIGGPDALAALAPALKESEHNTRQRAREAVKVLTNPALKGTPPDAGRG